MTPDFEQISWGIIGPCATSPLKPGDTMFALVRVMTTTLRAVDRSAYIKGVEAAVDHLKKQAWLIPMWIEGGDHDGEIDPDLFVEWLETSMRSALMSNPPS